MAQIYLTFDDGPDPEFTPRILDTLAEANMQATFFVVGENARRWPQLVRRAVREGHVIANHSLSHRHPWWMTSRRARQEVRGGADAISDILGSAAKHFRPPHGRVRPCMSDEARACGQSVVLWDVSATDWGPFGRAPQIAQRLERIQPNHIVLMHDARNEHNRPDELLKVLPALLENLRLRGWRSEALA